MRTLAATLLVTVLGLAVTAVLCNWMVAMGTVLGLTSNSTAGKIPAPIAAQTARPAEPDAVPVSDRL